MSRASKLKELLDGEGLTMDEAINMALDSTNPGICMNDDCDFINSCIEPDSSEGYCDACATQSCESLANLIMF